MPKPMMNTSVTWQRMFGRIFASTALLFALACSLMASPVLAQSRGGWEISTFASQMHVRADGVMEVTETIEGNFFEPRHGIYRFIPKRLQDGRRLGITPVRVTLQQMSVPYELSESSDHQQVIKIGDPNKEFSGPFSYQISYEVTGVVLEENGKDFFAWNVTGNGWDVPLTSVSAELTIEGVPSADISLECYTGPFGSTAQDCTKRSLGEQAQIVASDALTVQVLFPSGHVTARSMGDLRREQWLRNLDWLMILLPIGSFAFMYRRWKRDGRDPKAPSVEVVQYDPPDALRPLETMGIMSSSLSSNALAAFFVDLAERGHLTIEEGEKGWFGRRPYTLHRSAPLGEMDPPYAHTFLDALFKDSDVHLLTANDSTLLSAWSAVQTALHEELIEKGYFPPGNRHAPLPYILLWIALSFCAFWLGLFLAGVTERIVPLAMLLLAALPFGLFGIFMGRRTQKGADAYAHACGFRTYLKKAEAYRTIWQEQEGIFEKLLPYAIGFGVGKKWARVVGSTLQEPPSWYVGSPGVTFLPANFAGNISSFADTVTSSTTSTSSSGGGGFSGGGGGGGGGGSW